MALITDVIDVPDMIGYVRANAVLDGPTLESVLPPFDVEDIVLELDRLEIPHLEVASYRAWDAPAPLGKRQGFTKIRTEIAPMGKTMRLNEKELARFAALSAAFRNGEARNFRIEDIYDDALICARAILIREEKARADLLTDGKVTINENGFITESDNGVPGTHIVTAGVLWSDVTNSVPITNLKAWEKIVKDDTGGYPEAWLVSDEVMANLALNAQIRNLLPQLGVGGPVIPGLVPPDALATVFRQMGVRAPLVQFDGVVPTSTGDATEPTLGVRKVVAIKRGMGNTFRGVPPSADLLIAAGARLVRSEAPGIIAYAQTTVNPASVETTGEAVSLPVLRDPKALFVGTV